MLKPKEYGKLGDYNAGFIAGEASERSRIVRYLKGVLLTDRAAAIARGEHKE